MLGKLKRKAQRIKRKLENSVPPNRDYQQTDRNYFKDSDRNFGVKSKVSEMKNSTRQSQQCIWTDGKKIRKLDDKSTSIILSEKQKEKEGKNEHSPRDHWTLLLLLLFSH